MTENDTTALEFSSFGLDGRLLRIIAKQEWVKPTRIQLACIPEAIQGRDILARARTGSGKTLAFALPLLNKLLSSKAASNPVLGTRALILVPTKELARQITQQITLLTTYCGKLIRSVNLAGDHSSTVQRALLSEVPDVIISTPSRLLPHLSSENNLNLSQTLETLVIDEADLVLSFGYKDDVDVILQHLPRVYQVMLMSATLNSDMQQFQQVLLRNPVVIELEDTAEERAQLQQYVIRAAEKDKYLLMFALFKLKLISGKTLIFVNSIERCYKLKLFLEQFGIKSCVLNSELPQTSRYHTVEQFNRGVYECIIATDEGQSLQGEDDVEDEATLSARKASKQQKDHDYGVARGIDFQGVRIVLNFDFPCSARSYRHRVGRTARGHAMGTAISFVAPDAVVVTEQDNSMERTVEGRRHALILSRLSSNTKTTIKPYAFDLAQIEGFRYRTEDALHSVTRTAILEARRKEIKQELLHSEKLKQHFDEHPADLEALRQDRALRPSNVLPHLKHVPAYLLPAKLGGALMKAREQTETGEEPTGFVPFHRPDDEKRKRGRNQKQKQRSFFPSSKKRKVDPLSKVKTTQKR